MSVMDALDNLLKDTKSPGGKPTSLAEPTGKGLSNKTYDIGLAPFTSKYDKKKSIDIPKVDASDPFSSKFDPLSSLQGQISPGISLGTRLPATNSMTPSMDTLSKFGLDGAGVMNVDEIRAELRKILRKIHV